MKFTESFTYISRFFINNNKKPNPSRVIFIGYLLVILIGAILLMLPISHIYGSNVSFLAALFTSTSATSITGLIVLDTLQTWSIFGRIIILILVQIGALGFMTFTTIFFFAMNKKIGILQRLLIMKSLNLNDVTGVIKLIRHVLIGTLIFQGVGAALLWLRFSPNYGIFRGLGMGIFHSIMAFANAGFDLLGHSNYYGIASHKGDFVVIFVIISLSIIGGLGFFVWEDIFQNKFRFKRLHLHSKLVLSISFWIILLSWIFFFLAERNNYNTIGNMNLWESLYISLFQSIMPRSAGFSVVEQSNLLGATRMIIIILMLIGGSAGSTAGGIKNVTFGILFLSTINYFRGKSSLTIFRRTIPALQIKSALSISILVFFATIIGSVSISLIQPYLPFSAVIFETVSAISTSGLSYGITSSLSPLSQIIIIFFMFCGRVGIMTLGMVAFFGKNNDEKMKHPETWVIMG